MTGLTSADVRLLERMALASVIPASAAEEIDPERLAEAGYAALDDRFKREVAPSSPGYRLTVRGFAALRLDKRREKGKQK